MAIFQCDLLKNSKNRCIAIATELFFVFFRRKKNKHNGASYLFSFTKEDLVEHIRKRTIQTGRLFFSSSLTLFTALQSHLKKALTSNVSSLSTLFYKFIYIF